MLTGHLYTAEGLYTRLDLSEDTPTAIRQAVRFERLELSALICFPSTPFDHGRPKPTIFGSVDELGGEVETTSTADQNIDE